jgi:ArsR family transcriptional regulator
MKNYLKVMKALGDKNRGKIIKMLQHREMCVCELQAALGIAQPSVSKHLRILEEAGLVENRKDGLWVNYRLPYSGDSVYADHMLKTIRTWLNDDREMAELLKFSLTVDRCEISSKCR